MALYNQGCTTTINEVLISVAEVNSAAKQRQLNEGLMIWETTCTTIALIIIKDGLTADAWERNRYVSLGYQSLRQKQVSGQFQLWNSYIRFYCRNVRDRNKKDSVVMK